MKLSPLALAASLCLGTFGIAATASAQSIAPPTSFAPGAGRPHLQLNPAQTQGTIARFIVGPAGHVRGLQLDNGSLVFFHGRSGDTLAQQTAVGQSVRVDGMSSPDNATTLLHATVTASNGTVLVAPHAFAPGAGPQAAGAQGPQAGFGHRGWMHRDPAARAQMRSRMIAEMQALPMRNASGTVQTVLAGPRGHAHGVLLSDGTSVFFTHGMSRQLAQRGIHTGESIRVAGRGGAYAQGASVLAEQVTFADGGSINAPIGAAQPAP